MARLLLLAVPAKPKEYAEIAPASLKDYAQISVSMFDGTTDVDMSNKGLDAGDSHIIAAALEKNDLADALKS
jgi:hypothetical protein